MTFSNLSVLQEAPSDARRLDAEPFREPLRARSGRELQQVADRSGVSLATLYAIRAGRETVQGRVFDALVHELSAYEVRRDPIDRQDQVGELVLSQLRTALPNSIVRVVSFPEGTDIVELAGDVIGRRDARRRKPLRQRKTRSDAAPYWPEGAVLQGCGD